MLRLGEWRAARWIVQVATVIGFIVAMAPGIVPAEAAKRGGVLSFAVVAEPPTYDCHASTTFGVARIRCFRTTRR